jgi:hypothetical protein
MHYNKNIPWFWWPFAALWSLLTAVLNLIGRAVAGILGIGLILIGIVLTFTVILAPLGIPMIIIGLLFIFRSLF